MRRLRLVSAALTHLTKAEIASLREGPHLPGGTVLHNLVYGYAVDASLEPKWLVITDRQQPGRWRLLHNSFGPGQRCSVGSSLRYQPTPSTGEQRRAQDYTFKPLHRVYFYDAWRVLNLRESLTHKLLTKNQKLSCSKHLVSQVSQRPESKTEEKAGKRHAHFSPHT